MAPATNAPDRVDMRSLLWPAENVGQVAASAASAATTALQYHCNRMGEEPTDLSSLFVHYNARLASGQDSANVGTTMEAVMNAIAASGACRESTWPFDATKLTVRPPGQAYEEARKFAGVGYYNASDPVEALAMSYPVPVVIKATERSMREAGRSGVMPALTAAELQRPDSQINHAMLLVGYDARAKTFIARNCWGREWGADGDCTIPFDVLAVMAPAGTQRYWVITTAEAASDTPTASASLVASASPSSPEQTGRIADLAAKMRQEIRGDLERDISDASRRVREMLARPATPAPQVAARDVCPACSGRRLCPVCGGPGCSSCSNRGFCAKCSGRGVA